MLYLGNDYHRIRELLQESKVKKADVSSSQVTLVLESGARVVIAHEEYDGLNITASSD